MKKQLIIATLALGAIVFGTNNAQAQVSTATTTVNITLADVISIDAGSFAIGGTIDFLYDTALAYNQDQNWNVPNSLIVTSTKAFGIVVKANGPNFLGATDNIDLNVLTIIPTVGTSLNPMIGGTLTPVTLTDSDQPLVANAALGSAVTLDLDYFIPSTISSSAQILGKPSGAYTQTVTYTATAL